MDAVIPKQRMRRLARFNLRTLFLLIAAGGVLLGLWVRSAERQRVAVAAIEGIGGRVVYDFESSGTPAWLKTLLGRDYVGHPIAVTLPAIATDDHLVHVASLHHVESLIVDSSQAITDSGMRHLRRLTKLRVLAVSRAHVSDGGLLHVESLTTLEVLALNRTEVTDVGLVHLRNLKNLQRCELMGTRVTMDGGRRLQAALPGCRVYWDGWQQANSTLGADSSQSQ